MNNPFPMVPKSHRKAKALLALTFCAVASTAFVAAAVQDKLGSQDTGPPIATINDLGKAFSDVTTRVSPAVVNIQVEKRVVMSGNRSMPQGMPDWFKDEQLKRFFGDRLPKFEMPEQPGRTSGQGSGFIISKDGYILTNNHVVGKADQLKVTLSDGRTFEAKIVGSDSRSDVAVIKIDAKNLPVLPMGNSDAVQAGQWVLAVGSPFGLPGTVTSGIVSAVGRNSVGITDYENFIQTDAAINPGNSGGPLVDLRGEAIGINTAIFSRTGGYMGIGFAIPINMARDICDQLIENGSVTRGYLGIAIQELTADLAKSFGIEGTEGVLIGDVSKDSPAEQGGLKSGDVIVKFDGQEVKKVGAFRNRVAHASPGETVSMEVLRDGKRRTLDVIIGTLAPTGEVQSAATSSVQSLGLTVKPLDQELADQLGYANAKGVVVTQVQPGSKAADAGIEPGSLIKRLNRKPINTVAEFRQALDEASDSNLVLLLVRKGEYSRFVTLSLKD